MASTYTSNTGLEKPGTGEQVGTWGNTANDNFDIIDRLVSGVGAITLSGTTHTLATSDGALSEGQYKVLVFGGSPSGTNTVTISPNDQSKTYWVRNTSGQSVILTQGSGGNVTIADGDTALVYADGGGSGATVVDLTALIPVLSNAGVTATAAELNLLDGVTATTAELNLLDGVTATTAELNILDGVTATTAELNILDGVTATAAELNILDGVTATAAELNILDGVTATTAELNLLDGITFRTSGDGFTDSDTALMTAALIQDYIQTATLTLTNKTATNITLDGGFTEEISSVSGTTPAITPNNGSIQTWVLSGNSTPTSGSWANGQSVLLMIDDGTSYAVTWTSMSVTWLNNNGVAPTLAETGYSSIMFFKLGGALYGVVVGVGA